MITRPVHSKTKNLIFYNWFNFTLTPENSWGTAQEPIFLPVTFLKIYCIKPEQSKLLGPLPSQT